MKHLQPGILLLALLMYGCPEKHKPINMRTNCGNTAKWFNSVGKTLKVTVKVTDGCPGRDSSVSIYKTESDIAPDVFTAKDGVETSLNLDVPSGGYVKLTCNGSGNGECKITIIQNN